MRARGHGHWRWGWLAGLAWAVPVAAQTGGKLTPELASCLAANRQTYVELMQAHEAALRRSVLNPVAVTRLQAVGTQIARWRDQLAKNPRNQAECEATAQALAGARETVDRVGNAQSQLAECTAASLQALDELKATLTPAAAARLDPLRASLEHEGQTLAECRQLAADIAQLREQQRLTPPAVAVRPAAPATATAAGAAAAPAESATAAASAPSPEAAAQCRQAQARNYNDLAQTYARLVSEGPIANEWMAPLQALTQRLTQLHAQISNPAAPNWNCGAVEKALAQARAELLQIVRR